MTGGGSSEKVTCRGESGLLRSLSRASAASRATASFFSFAFPREARLELLLGLRHRRRPSVHSFAVARVSLASVTA